MLAGSSAGAASPSPVPSIGALTTGNGFGFQVFDLTQKKITQFLERPYRYLRPGANQQATGVERRNLAYDVYLGLRAGATGAWLTDPTVTQAAYVAESSIMRSVGTVAGVQAESYFFSPFGYSGNALIVLLHATNSSGAPVAVDAFLNPNFHMGAGTGDTPSSDNETIATSGMISTETGPGGGIMVYQPFGFDKADCSGTGFTRVTMGMDLANTPQSCANMNDVTIDFQKSLGTLAAGADAWWGAAIQFAPDGNSANAAAAMTSWLGSRTPDKILSDAQAEWESWRKAPPAGLSSDENLVWREAESVLRMSQVLEPWTASPKQKGYGMILASLPPGQWHIGWVRDAQFATVALARMGHLDEARRALEFFLDAEANQYQTYTGVPYRVSVVRYFGDGEEESDWDADGPNIEFDGWGLYLWAARTYLDLGGDSSWLDGKTRAGETVYDVLRDQVALPIDHNLESDGIIGQDTSIWESHWNNRKHYTFTSLAAARGLCDFASMAARYGDATSATKYSADSTELRAGIHANLVDSQLYLGGSKEGIAAGKYHDAATLAAFNWELYPTSDPVWAATLDGLSNLQVGSGGYMRNDDALSSYDSDEWVMIDLRASAALRSAGRTPAADSLVAWVTAQARANQNLIPELYNQTSGAIPIDAYSGAIPMVGFGAAAYVLALSDRAGAASLSTSCDGTPPFGSDGGTTTSNDLSVATGSDGSVSMPSDAGADSADLARGKGGKMSGIGSGGGACGCQVGARRVNEAPLPLALLLLLFFLPLSRRRGRASRGRGRAAG